MPRLSRLFVIHASILLFLFVVVRTNAQKLAPLPNFQPEWVRDYPPFRIAGNFFYVGTYDLASYLITTPAGPIRSSADISKRLASGSKISRSCWLPMHISIMSGPWRRSGGKQKRN
jgi:hypothetical protein